MDMLTEFPSLILQDENKTHYDGCISIHRQMYRLEIKIPASQRLSDATVNCDWRLYKLIKDFKSIIAQRLKQCEDVVSFLKELKMIAKAKFMEKDNYS